MMHSLPMLQCFVPTSDAIACHWQTHRISLRFQRLFVCRVCQTFMADNAGLLREGLCNKLDGLETAVTEQPAHHLPVE